jgi:phage-related protein
VATPKPKPVVFLGDSRERLSAFPPSAKSRVGVELFAVQTGREPSDWKPMKTIGQDVREIRVRDKSGAYRVIYLATLADRVLVLHAFQKKSQKTSQRDIELATKRLREWKANDGKRNLR